MKRLALFSLILLSFSALAQEREPTLKSVLGVSTCRIKITQKPVIFGKDQAHGRSQRLVFFSHEISSHLRRLSPGRSVKISGVTKSAIQLDDISLNSLCVLDGKKCGKGIDRLTISQLEKLSGNNVKFLCERDKIKDI